MVLGVRGEASALLKRANAGIVIEPENSAQLVDAILRFYDNRNLANSLGNNGRSFIQKYFSRKRMAVDYIEVLSSSQLPS